MANRLIRLLRDRNVIMLLALAAGLVWGAGARWTEWTTLPSLAVIMTIATVNVRWGEVSSFRAAAVPALAGIGMTYLVQAVALIAAARLLVRDEAFRAGFMILAVVPPAVAVIPFTLFVRGNSAFSLFGTMGSYLGALVIAPLMMLLLLGPGIINPVKLVTIFIELIIAPVVLARILSGSRVSARVEPFFGTITNWGFFLIVYTMVGLNRNAFLGNPAALLPVTLVAALTTFLVGWLIEAGGRLLKLPPSTVTSIVLLGTFKNYGLAGGIALVFFSDRTMVPATVTSVVSILYIIWLGIRAKRRP
jgi:bile acid:Na+ symporter, BASS family